MKIYPSHLKVHLFSLAKQERVKHTIIYTMQVGVYWQ